MANGTARPRFREDINGLRGFACLLALSFHVTALPRGAYIALDVFFVISGFLITWLLVAERERTGRVDVVDYYRRRARRILPPALLVLVVTTVVAALVWYRTRFDGVLQDAVATLLFAQNWHLVRQSTDYLRGGSGSPFEHYWSLSVEEQFYAFWPLLVILGTASVLSARARRPVLLAAVLVVLAGSLAVAVVGATAFPATAYLNTGVRVWELAAGAAALLISRTPVVARAIARPRVRVVTGLLGAVGLLVPLVTYGPLTSFPWPAVVVPVLASVLIVGGGADDVARGDLVRRVLAARPLGWVGTISYSLYLWHLPVILFGRILLGDSPMWWPLFVAVSVGLATLSYHWVERPFRSPSVPRATSRSAGPGSPRPRASDRRRSAASDPRCAGAPDSPRPGAPASPRPRVRPARSGVRRVVAVSLAIGVPVLLSSASWFEASGRAGVLALEYRVPEAERVPVAVDQDGPRGVWFAAERDLPASFDDPSLAAALDGALAATRWPSGVRDPLDGALNPLRAPAVMPEIGCLNRARSDAAPRTCSWGDPSAARSAVVIGDSAAMSWTAGVASALVDEGWYVEAMGYSGCPAVPLRVHERARGAAFPAGCDAAGERMRQFVADRRPGLAVVGAGDFEPLLVSGATGRAAMDERRAATERGLGAVARSADRVVVIGAPPAGPMITDCVTRITGPGACEGRMSAEHRRDVMADRAAVRAVAASGRAVSYVDTEGWFCRHGRCPAFADGTLVRYDATHLTRGMSERLRGVLGPALSPGTAPGGLG